MGSKMVPGTVVPIGGEDFIVPPLSITQLRAFLPRVQQLVGLDAAQMGDAQLEVLVAIITTALQRNYPELTTAKVEEILDLGNALPVLNAILGGIKLPPAEPKLVKQFPGKAEPDSELIGQGAPEPAGVGLEPTRPAPGAGPAPGHFNPDYPAEAGSASDDHNPMEPYYPWRPNPPVVGS
jgi:hypothetical protein